MRQQGAVPVSSPRRRRQHRRSALQFGGRHDGGHRRCVLVARSNTLDVRKPLVPLVLNALMNPQRGAVTLIRLEGESRANTQR